MKNMKKINLFPISILAILLLLSYGCSSGNPLVTSDYNNKQVNSNLPVGVSDWNLDGSPSTGMGILGLFNVLVDPVSMTGELESIRKNATTDVLEVVDITNFLSLAPCSNCVKIKSVALDSLGRIVVSIGIKHPFPAGDPYKPVTGRNRADLHVFNIEGIVVSNAAGINFPGTGASISGMRLVNSDGYTGYLDASLDDFFPTDANVHPYILHFDDYSQGNFDPANAMGFQNVTDPPPTGNLVMAMGCDYNFQDYIFDIDGDVEFIYAVGCTYAISAATKSERFTPEYRIPQHNKKAASEIKVLIIDNNLRSGITTSTANIEIDVVDLSHGVPVGSALNETLSDSSVDDIFVDIPGVLASPMVIDGSAPSSGSGHSPADPLSYHATVTNSAGGLEGSYIGMVKVKDNYAPGQNGSPLLNGMDGIKRVDPVANPLTGLFQINEFATYQAFDISVGQRCGPITGSVVSPSCPITGLNNNGNVNITVQASSDNGGDPVVLYEADYSYDGTTFNVDASNTTGAFNAGPFIVPDPCPSNIPRTFKVAFRATDSCPVPNKIIFATCDVTVTTCVQWKNIPLRAGHTPGDLAMNPDGSLLIVYEDGQVWKYFETSYYSHTTAQYLFTAEVVQWSALTPPPTPVLANAFMDVSDSGNIFASNNDGSACILDPLRIGLWPAQSFTATGTPLGQGPTHCTAGPIRDVFCYKSGSSGWPLYHVVIAPDSGGTQSNMYIQWPGSWGWAQMYGQNCHGLGYEKINALYVVGSETCSANQFWALEDTPDYYCSRYIHPTTSIFYYYYDNMYFGTGTKTDVDSCWNEAKDLTMDSRDNLYVLDKLSNGKGRVKGFTGSVTGGTSLGHFDVPDQFSANPLRIEGSMVSGPNGNLVFILHGDPTAGYYLSVFLPADIPW